MEADAKYCYSLFANHLKTQSGDTDKMTLQDIKSHSGVLYMKYILSCPFSISKECVVTIAYNHLQKMIRDAEIEIINNEYKKKIASDGSVTLQLQEPKPNSETMQQLSNQQSKGWFFK